MNNEEDEISRRPDSDQAIEARVVAWVLGEASAFEIAELTRMLEERPALAAYKQQIEITHRLVNEAAKPDARALRLSAARRKSLMATLGIENSITGEDESRAAASSLPDAMQSAIGASEREAKQPKKPTTAHGSGTSSVLIYPIAQKKFRWSSGAVRAMAIACSVMLTFLVLRVNLRAPRPIMRKEIDSGSHVGVYKQNPNSYKEPGHPVALPAAPVAPDLAAINAEDDVAPSQVLESTPPLPAKPLDADPKSNSPSDFLDSKDAPVALEPFEVEASQDTGYRASNTLAGTRIHTELNLPEFNSNGKSIGRGYAAKSLSGDDLSDDKTSLVPERALKSDGANRGVIFGGGESAAAPARTSALAASAQAAPAAAEADEMVQLSPFSVQKDLSSEANANSSTLAGTRIRTDLKDTASAISSVTQQFLSDAGATDAPNSLGYSEEKEIGGAARSDARSRVKKESEISALEAAKTEVPPSDKKLRDRSDPLVEKSSPTPSALNIETTAQVEPVSTFSLHVSDVSFRLAVAAEQRGERLEPASVRTEEFYNAFDYGDNAPAQGEKVVCHIEQSAHPTLQQRNLLRVALRVPSTGRGSSQPVHLTVLLDTSGSMQRRDRAALVHAAMQSLVSLLGPNDRITLIGFARTPRLLAENVSGDQAKNLPEIAAKVPAAGGTNFDAALTLGAEMARRQKLNGAQNRIVLLTDGAANLGDANPQELSKRVEMLRQEGIAFDACGVGTRGVDDTALETLTRHGDGRYLVLSTAEAATALAKQLAGAFHPAAKNVKVQVRFNPNRVAHYRLLGFLHHRLNEADFRNDKVDAAELAADEAANALYEVEPLPSGDGAIGEIFVRFQDTLSGQMVERSWTIPYDAHVSRFDRAAPALQLAGSAALIAQYLQGEPIKLDELVKPMAHVRSHFSNESKVQDLVTLFEQLRRDAKKP